MKSSARGARRLWMLTLTALILTSAAHANTYIWATAPGATVGGWPVDITVTFNIDTTAHTITIAALNLEGNIARDFQALSSMQITLSNLNTSATPAPSVTSSSFSEINITSSSSPATVQSPLIANHWLFPTAGAYSVGSGNTLTFCTNCPTGGNFELLIGAPDSTGTYSAGNASVVNGAHDPWILACGSSTNCTSGNLSGLDSTPQWVLSVPQLTSTSTITGVTFGFGTAWGTLVTAGQNNTPTPEPGSIVLVLTGGVLIGLARYRQRSRSRTRSA